MIRDLISTIFEGKEYQPSYFHNSALFTYPCPETFKCSPISLSISRGTYLFELWGAQGGDARIVNSPNIRENSGGKGAYVSGEITLYSKRNLYLYIGGKGEDQISTKTDVYSRGGFNGGGKGGIEPFDEPPESSAGGGGATDIRIIEGDDIESYKSRIIVAAGGGGACSTNGTNSINYDYRGGHGGKIEGITFNNITKGGHHNDETFFQGKDGLSRETSTGTPGGSTGGGGGGYYGGDSIELSETTQYYQLEVGGAGGSSYVSGFKDCNVVNNLYQYSSLIFRNIHMESGQNEFYKPLNYEYEKGHSGNGTFVITFLYPIAMTCKSLNFKNIFSFLCFIYIFK